MSPLRKRRVNLVALVALLGLFFQALMPLAQAIPLGNYDDGLTGRIVICSAYGIKTIDLATGIEVPDDEESPGRQSGSGECVVCLSFAIGDNALSNACEAAHPQISGQSVAFRFFPQDIPHFRYQNGIQGARAPPAA